jgi:hypothetical protein
MPTIRDRIQAFLNPPAAVDLAAVTSRPGWTSNTGRPHERDFSELKSLYEDSLTAFRKNPIAWIIFQTTTNYILGEKIIVSSLR